MTSGAVVPLFKPVEPEFGDGDGEGPDRVECPECGCQSFRLEWYEDGEIAAVCESCDSELALTIIEDHLLDL